MSLPNTANALAKGTMFPAELIPVFINNVKGHSSLAKMSTRKPLAFNGNTLFTFSMDNDIDIVAEAGAKSAGGAQVGTKTITPVKVEYGLRVSDEFDFAAEEIRLDYMRQFAEGFAIKMARGLDIMAMHGYNPRTGTAANTVIGNNHLDYVAQTPTAGADYNASIDLAITERIAAGYDVDGVIVGQTVRAALAAMTVGTGDARPIYPELRWGGKPDNLNGTRFDFNPTVEAYGSYMGYVGDFERYFRWGIAKELPIEIIRYGNPDNDATAGDLAGHNQIYLRGEAYIGWAFLDNNAFAKIAEIDDDVSGGSGD